MESYFYLALGCACVVLLPDAQVRASSIDPAIKAKVDNYIENQFQPINRNPALGFSILNGNGSLLYANGYGLMDIDKQLPTTNETLFLMGSLSKSFAAIIVAKTLHEKFPDLDDVIETPIRKLIPDFNFTLNDRYRSEQVTFRDMLSHRVCATPDGVATLTVPFKNYSEVAYRQRYAPQQCNFRTSFVYNNGMYAVVTEVIQAIAGRTYQSMLLEFFNDLGMASSTFVKDNDEDEIPARAVPYYWRDDERHKYNPKLLKRVVIATAAGGIVSNAVDMAKYLQFHLNKGKVGERQVVPEKVMKWLYEPAVQAFLIKDKFEKGFLMEFAYGLGLIIGLHNGWDKLGHSGSVPPYLSWFSFYPELNIGIFSTTNQQPLNSSLDHQQLHNAIFDILTGVQSKTKLSSLFKSPVEQDMKSVELNFTNGQNHGTKTRLPQDYVGLYGNGLQGELEVSQKLHSSTNTTELYMNWGQWGQAYLLQAENESKYLLEWDSDIIHDRYALELGFNTFAVFNTNITQFQLIEAGANVGTFIRNVKLDGLPAIPWSPQSCGPENFKTT